MEAALHPDVREAIRLIQEMHPRQVAAMLPPLRDLARAAQRDGPCEPPRPGCCHRPAACPSPERGGERRD